MAVCVPTSDYIDLISVNSGKSIQKKSVTVTCFYHNSCCQPYVKSMSSLLFWSRQCSDINISQRSLTKRIRRDGGIFNYHFIAKFLENAKTVVTGKTMLQNQLINQSCI